MATIVRKGFVKAKEGKLAHGTAALALPLPSASSLNTSLTVNSVSVSLYGAATSTVPAGNLMVSPLSILYSTILVYLGSRGSTRANLFNKLDLRYVQHSDDTDANTDVVAAFGQLMNDLKPSSTNRTGKRKDAANADRFQLALANGVFLQDGLNVDKDYLATANQNLKASVELKNFMKNPEAARKDINKWVEERTGGRIKNLIPSGGVDSSTVAVLANAIYFKARWEKTFDDFLTDKNADFFTLNGKTVKAKLMRNNRKFAYAEDDKLGVQYVELPYAGGDASMLVYLPKAKTGLRELEKTFTTVTMDELAKKAQDDARPLVDLFLPKFRVETSFDLVQLLMKIGVEDVFTENADLTGMVPAGNVKVSAAFHKTFIEVDEKGTEAAAASATVVAARSGMVDITKPKRVTFRADHPFMYAIRHNPSKSILFMGRLETL